LFLQEQIKDIIITCAGALGSSVLQAPLERVA
jgi:hypothetical protein